MPPTFLWVLKFDVKLGFGEHNFRNYTRYVSFQIFGSKSCLFFSRGLWCFEKIIKVSPGPGPNGVNPVWPRRGRGQNPGWPRRGRGQNILPGPWPRRGRGQNYFPGPKPRRGRGHETGPGFWPRLKRGHETGPGFWPRLIRGHETGPGFWPRLIRGHKTGPGPGFNRGMPRWPRLTPLVIKIPGSTPGSGWNYSRNPV